MREQEEDNVTIEELEKQRLYPFLTGVARTLQNPVNSCLMLLPLVRS